MPRRRKSLPSLTSPRVLILLHQHQEDSPMRRQPSFKWAQYVKPAKSPTKPDIIESPQPYPQHPEHNIPYNRTIHQAHFQATNVTSDRPRVQVLPVSDSPGSTSQLSAQSKSSKESTDNFKSFKVSL